MTASSIKSMIGERKHCLSCGEFVYCSESISPVPPKRSSGLLRWMKKKGISLLCPLRTNNNKGKGKRGGSKRCSQCDQQSKKGIADSPSVITATATCVSIPLSLVSEEDNTTTETETSSHSYTQNCDDIKQQINKNTNITNKNETFTKSILKPKTNILMHNSNSIRKSTIFDDKKVKSGQYVYIGDYDEKGKRSGHGEMIWSNGDRYVGQFVNGQRHGEGTMYVHDGSQYKGQWEKDRMHGHGTRHYVNGDVYVGPYVNGKRSTTTTTVIYTPDDIGKFYFANGDTYQGEWVEDQIHGFGRFDYIQSDMMWFEGSFKDGKRHGMGKLQHPNGELDICYYNYNQRTFPVVRWSKDRSKVWKILKQKYIDNIGKGRDKLFQVPISTKEAITLSGGLNHDFDGKQHSSNIVVADVRPATTT